MKTSQAGLNLIKQYEGLRLKAYPDPGTNGAPWTIGYGHTSAAGFPKVDPGLQITASQAEDILQNDLGKYEKAINDLVHPRLTQNQFDALVSFVFNVGPTAFAKSTLLKRINADQFDQVPAEFMKWTRAGGQEMAGLVRRRRAEVKMWRDLETDTPVNTAEASLAPDLPKPSKKITQSREANGALIAGAGGAAAVAEQVIPVVKQGQDLFTHMSITAWICVGIVIVAIAIWYWRKQRLDEEGA